MATKAGAHFNGPARDGWRQVAEAGPAIAVSVADSGVLDEAKRWGGPNTITVYRHWAPERWYGDYPADVAQWPDTDFARAAADYWWEEVLWPDYQANPADYYQPICEAAGDDVHSIRMMVAFEIRLMELAEQHGVKLAVGSLSYDSPRWDLWVEHYVPLFRRAGQGGHVISRHAYGGAQAAQRVLDEARYLLGHGIATPILVTEAGLGEGQSFAGVDAFMAQVRLYEDAFADQPNVWAFAMWTYPDMAPASAALAEHILSLGGAAPPPAGGLEYGSDAWKQALAGAADAYSTTNPDAALQKFILARPPWRPYGKETWTTAAGGTYAVQTAIRWDTEERRHAFCRVPDWGNVGWVEDVAGPAPQLSLGVPLSGPYAITGRFNDSRSYGKHEGTDFAPRAAGSKVLACAAGVVDYKGYKPTGYGYYVRLRHERAGLAYLTWYGHMASPSPLAVGTAVARGQVLGDVGSSGYSTGLHVHLTVQIPGHGLAGYVVADVVDPLPFVDLAEVDLPPAGQLDLLPYLRPVAAGNGPAYTLRYDWAGGGTHPVQVQADAGGRFYVVKGGGQYEELWPDGDAILRGVDTSEAADKYYIYYTPAGVGLRYGGRWVPRWMAVGQAAVLDPYIIHYWQADCSKRGPEGRPSWTIQLVAQHARYRFPSGIELADVVELRWNDYERYWFARGHGLVAWDGTGIGMGKSYIDSYLPAGTVLPRERPPCLQE